MQTQKRLGNDMAFISTSKDAQGGLSEMFAAAVRGLVERAEKRLIYRRTLNELSALSSRDLADLGVNRSMLRSIAHQAAYGAK